MRFEKILSLRLVQDYFGNGDRASFRFEPTVDCETMIRRFALFFRSDGEGFTIVKDIDNLRDPSVPEHYFFDIGLFPSHDRFPVYSGLDIDYRRRRVYYLGNEKPGEGEETTAQLGLTEAGVGETFQAVPVVLKPKKFMFSLEVSRGDTVVMVDKAGVVVREWGMEDREGEVTLYADMGKRVSGVYRVERNRAVVGRYYADDRFYKEKPAVILGFGLALGDLKVEESYVHRVYEVRVMSRSIFWRYHIVVRGDGRLLGNVRIDNNNQKFLPGVIFEEEGIDEGRREIVFVSSRPIPLMEKGYMGIELSEKEGSGRPLIANLPNPEISAVKYKDGKWFSDIFVYI